MAKQADERDQVGLKLRKDVAAWLQLTALEHDQEAPRICLAGLVAYHAASSRERESADLWAKILARGFAKWSQFADACGLEVEARILAGLAILENPKADLRAIINEKTPSAERIVAHVREKAQRRGRPKMQGQKRGKKGSRRSVR